MPQVKEITVYKIDELSDKAKDRAHSEWVDSNEYFWASENKATLKKFVELLPIKAKNWEYDSCNGIVYWVFTDYEREDFYNSVTGPRLMSWIENNFLRYVRKGKYYSTKGHYIDGKYHYKHRYSKCQFSASDCPLTGYCVDMGILEPILKFMQKPDKHTTLYDLIGSCFDSWVKACVNDVQYQNSMECFIESCQANNYTFTESGKMENL